jgi:hypothetical protein
MKICLCAQEIFGDGCRVVVNPRCPIHGTPPTYTVTTSAVPNEGYEDGFADGYSRGWQECWQHFRDIAENTAEEQT